MWWHGNLMFVLQAKYCLPRPAISGFVSIMESPIVFDFDTWIFIIFLIISCSSSIRQHADWKWTLGAIRIEQDISVVDVVSSNHISAFGHFPVVIFDDNTRIVDAWCTSAVFSALASGWWFSRSTVSATASASSISSATFPTPLTSATDTIPSYTKDTCGNMRHHSHKNDVRGIERFRVDVTSSCSHTCQNM